MSIAKLAAGAQSSSGYGVDAWLDISLEPMTKVWQGMGGASNFFFSEEDAREARGSYMGTNPYRFAETLWRLAQVSPSAKYGYRSGIAEFVVDLPVAAAVGICHANSSLGSGSVFQYYIPDWDKALYRTGRTYTFKQTAY
ncbi:hypothetical protein [Enhygromyxa salina]|uniref:Uncharacterized protein n=1 Tax=Enhygromyxa salina TaxID=215803 RepID=A0A2S9YIW3_9BACT|nr:hypothetical protein [Enhygromyxa salina]PRQ05039.1 hypothetical protein ENSA7_48220 [Enhygromyxa salina]